MHWHHQDFQIWEVFKVSPVASDPFFRRVVDKKERVKEMINQIRGDDPRIAKRSKKGGSASKDKSKGRGNRNKDRKKKSREADISVIKDLKEDSEEIERKMFKPKKQKKNKVHPKISRSTAEKWMKLSKKGKKR